MAAEWEDVRVRTGLNKQSTSSTVSHAVLLVGTISVDNLLEPPLQMDYTDYCLRQHNHWLPQTCKMLENVLQFQLSNNTASNTNFQIFSTSFSTSTVSYLCWGERVGEVANQWTRLGLWGKL